MIHGPLRGGPPVKRKKPHVMTSSCRQCDHDADAEANSGFVYWLLKLNEDYCRAEFAVTFLWTKMAASLQIKKTSMCLLANINFQRHFGRFHIFVSWDLSDDNPILVLNNCLDRKCKTSIFKPILTQFFNCENASIDHVELTFWGQDNSLHFVNIFKCMFFI